MNRLACSSGIRAAKQPGHLPRKSFKRNRLHCKLSRTAEVMTRLIVLLNPNFYSRKSFHVKLPAGV